MDGVLEVIHKQLLVSLSGSKVNILISKFFSLFSELWSERRQRLDFEWLQAVGESAAVFATASG